MSWSASFFVLGTPRPQGSKRPIRMANGRVGMIESCKELSSWRQDVAAVAAKHRPALPTQWPVSVQLDFYLPRPKSVRRQHPTTKPDIDKLIRAVLDALTTAKVWEDDSQVIACTSVKRYADGDTLSGVAVTVAEVIQ